MNQDLIKLILGWLIVIGMFCFLASDKGIAYPETGPFPDCAPDYMGSCN